ncbi:MAG TPA: hypothetical protein VEU62_16510 [Bryobacterales bacterium]|nr:hypothetical protein [Bryobacterales bacterium]
MPSSGDLLKSTDGGATWGEASSGLTGIPSTTGPMLLAIDPKNSSTLYVATATGLFKSTDGAASWSAAGSGLPDQVYGQPFFSLQALVIDPQNPSTLYAATTVTLGYGGVLFKSTDGAASWSAINSGLTGTGLQITSLAIDPKNPHTLYASGGTLFKSTDAGSNWAVANDGLVAQSLAIDPQDSSTLYAPSDHGVLKSVDGGGTWSVVLASPPAAGWVAVAPGERRHNPIRARTRFARGPSTVYAGAGGLGILKSTDGGATWAAANSGLTATSISALAVNPQNPSTVYAGVYGAGIFKSTDGASTWSANPVLSESNVPALAVDPRNASTVYATIGAGFNTAGAFKSTDGGRNWVKLDVGVLAIDPQDSNTLYGLGGFKSTDGGASWVKLVVPQSAWITALAIDPQDRNTLYAGGDVAGPCELNPALFKSVDGGNSWTTSLGSLGCYSLFINRLVADPRNTGTAYATAGCIDGPCPSFPLQYRTTDGGATWNQWELPEQGFFGTVDPHGTIYANTYPTGLLRSTDGGTTWSAVVTTGLPSNTGGLAFDPQNPNHLYAGTSAGVFEITLAPAQQ